MNGHFPMLAAGLIFSALATAAELPASLTLDQAIAQALQGNRELASQEIALQNTYLTLEGARNEFRFTLTPDGSVSRSDDREDAQAGLSVQRKLPWGTELSAGATYNEDRTEDRDAQRYAVYRVQLEQPLFRRAGRLVNEEPVVQAQAAVLSARRRLELAKSDLAIRVARTHQDLARLQSQIHYDEQALRRYDQLQRLTRVREAQGRVTRIDSLRVEFDRGRSELNIATTRERLQSLRKDLAELLGLPPDTELQAEPSPLIDITLTNAADAEAIALSNRLDYADSLQALADAGRGVRIARVNLGPDLGVVASYEELDGLSDDAPEDDDTWYLALSGGTDLLRRNERLQLGRAKLGVRTAQSQLEILENSIRRQVQQGILAYQRSLDQLRLAERNHGFARDRARLARRMFEIGRGDNFAVTDAETALLEAESSMLQTRAESVVTAFQLLRTLGILLEAPTELKVAGDAGGKEEVIGDR